MAAFRRPESITIVYERQRDFKCDVVIRLLKSNSRYQSKLYNNVRNGIYILFSICYLFGNSYFDCIQGRIGGIWSELFLAEGQISTNHRTAGDHVTPGLTKDTSISTNEHYLSATVFPPITSEAIGIQLTTWTGLEFRNGDTSRTWVRSMSFS